jgi:hypothetical protein
MTIGMVDYSPNPECFARLLQVSAVLPFDCQCRAFLRVMAPSGPRSRGGALWYAGDGCRIWLTLCSHDSRPQPINLELSMGMSGDFEQAISM